MSSWLQRQRKDDLKDLADDAGFKGAGSMTKQDLVPALDEYLRANISTLSLKVKFADYYESAARSASPIKKEADSLGKTVVNAAEDAAKAANKAKRRVTKAAEELIASAQPAATGTTTTTVAPPEGAVPATSTRSHTTPRSGSSKSSSSRRQSLASSPRAAVQVVRERTSSFWDKHVADYVDAVQESLSTVYAVHMVSLAAEGLGLLSIVLPTGFDINLATWKIKDHTELAKPDLNKALSGAFWWPVALWALTSVFLPLLAGFAVNLTQASGVSRKHQRDVDPVSFNVAKVLIAWLVYDASNLPLYGSIDSHVVRSVKSAGFGLMGIYTSAAVGALAGIYDAILKK